jgi:3-oxoacyl-[acyl-carrier-protein] synthase III
VRDGRERRAEHAPRPDGGARSAPQPRRAARRADPRRLRRGRDRRRLPDEAVGFHWLDLVSGARHDHYCWSKPSSRGSGGILVTKARGLQIEGNRNFPAYLKQALDATGWDWSDVHHVIPHQVSTRAIRQGIRAISRYMGCELPDVFLSHAETFGNTTTASHALALHDFILRGTIRSGQNVLLVSGASGIVISHATFTFDDLPDRYRAHVNGAPA